MKPSWCDRCGTFERIVHEYKSYNSYYKRYKMHGFCASCVKEHGYRDKDMQIRVA